jgi:thioredoxin reductase
MAKTEGRERIAVIGGGPIGLEAALYARSLGYPVTLFERSQVGEYVRRWGHVRLFSPFGMNATPLGRAAIRAEDSSREFPADAGYITGKEHLAAYLEPLAKTEPLRKCIRKETRVLFIGRKGFLKEDDPGDPNRAQQPFCLLIRDSNKRDLIEEADIVLDCTGTYGQHRWLGDGGIPAAGELAAEQHIAFGLEDILGERRSHYAGKTILVVGGSYSAATTVCNLATVAEQQLDTWVIWLVRCAGTQPLPRIANDPLRERDRLAVRANTLATRGDGNVEFHNHALVEAVECPDPNKGFKVTARCAGKPRTWEVDRLIANVGYSPDISLYRELQVHESFATLGPFELAAALRKYQTVDPGSGPGGSALRNPEPNFYILGAKSYGRYSHFLLRNGFEQIREVFAAITGKPKLNLYTSRS